MPNTTMSQLSVNGAFKEFLRRIELNPTRVAIAQTRYQSIKDTIEIALPGKKVRQIGSFQKATKIRPVDLSDAIDLDIIVSFGEFSFWVDRRAGTTTESAINQVRSALRSNERYRIMDPIPDSPAVVLQYADEFNVEIVPGYEDKTGKYNRSAGEPNCYVVPSSNGAWVPADYDYDANYIARLNQSQGAGQALVPAIKIMKSFMRSKDLPLISFHTEILAAQILPRAFIDWNNRGLTWGYHHAVAYFLENVASHLAYPVSLPGSYSPPVDSGLNSERRVQIGQTLSKYGELAWKICKLEKDSDAISLWHDFMGDPFPVG